MPPAKRKTTKMTNEHKAALAEGRNQGRAVRVYLEALEQNKPKRGRKRTPDSVKKQLASVEQRLSSASGTAKLELLQKRADLKEEMGRIGAKIDLSDLEKDFVKVAKGYGSRKGISYGTWREFGVPADVLKRAGIGRGA